MRQNFLHDQQVERLEGFRQTRGIRFAVKHRRPHNEGGAHRIGFPGLHCFQGHPEVPLRFGRHDLVDALCFGHLPLFAVGALPGGHVGFLKAAARRDDETALLVDVAVKGIENADQLISRNVVTVLTRVPTVIDAPLESRVVASDLDDLVRRNARDFRRLLRCVMRRDGG